MITVDQVKEVLRHDYDYDKIANELNKLLENEPTNAQIKAICHEVVTNKFREVQSVVDEQFDKLSGILNQIQEQLTSLSGENISKQFALFLEKQGKRDSDILRNIAILDEKVKERWGDNYRVEFDIDPECGSGSVNFLVNDTMESIEDFHEKDNYESVRNTTIHALVTIDWDKFEESPQKEETQEKSCATCNHFDVICKKDWCGDSYKGWQPRDNQVKLCVESFNTPSGKKDNQDESCKNCSIDKYCDGYCSGFQAKDNQESR